MKDLALIEIDLEDEWSVQRHWIGGIDYIGKGNFKWVTDNTSVPTDSQYWAFHNEPKGDLERTCLEGLYSDDELKFYQGKCEEFHYFICKKGAESFKGIDHHLQVLDYKVNNLFVKEENVKKRLEIMDNVDNVTHTRISHELKNMEDRIDEIDEQISKQITTPTTTAKPTKEINEKE